jgi:hypothetical protein
MQAERPTALVAWAIISVAMLQAAVAADLAADTVVAERDASHAFQPGWNLLERGGHSLEFRGYYRYGYGRTQDGEPMPSFGAPGLHCLLPKTVSPTNSAPVAP